MKEDQLRQLFSNAAFHVMSVRVNHECERISCVQFNPNETEMYKISEVNKLLSISSVFSKLQ